MRRYAPLELQFIKTQIDTLLQAGFIEEISASKWLSPIVLAPKKGAEGLRLCVAYCALNRDTLEDNYPLPRCDDLLDKLAGFSYYTTVDGFSGFYSVGLSEESKQLTAFKTPFGVFQWTVMPFGLKNAPGVYSRLVDEVYGQLPQTGVFIDDVCTGHHTQNTIAEDLTRLLARCRWAGLRLKPSKCFVGYQQVEFLGHVLSAEGMAMMRSKVEKVLDILPPTTGTGMAAFLGLCGYYRRFIKDFAQKSKGLTGCVKHPQIIWDMERGDSFQQLKEAVAEQVVLARPDYSKEFIVDSDASNFAVGAVLSQKQIGQDGKERERPIYFFSKVLTQCQKNYSTTEKEGLAVVLAVVKWRVYLLGSKVKVRVDHQPLLGLFKKLDVTGRVARWLVILSEYNISWEFRKGLKHQNADGLSRARYLSKEGDTVINTQEVEDDLPACFMVKTRNAIPERFEQCAWSRDIVACLQGKVSSNTISRRAQRFTLQDDELWYIDQDLDWKKCVPTSEVPAVLACYHQEHGAGHFGKDLMVTRMAKNVYWPSMVKDAGEWVRKCQVCQQFTAEQRKGKLRPYRPIEPFEVIQLDYIVKMPRSTTGKTAILTVVEALSGWVTAKAVSSPTAVEALKGLMEEVIYKFGFPLVVITDNGSHFKGVFDVGLKKMQVPHHFTPVYHPQSLGKTERMNGLIKGRLKKELIGKAGRNWDQHLPAALLSINTRSPRRTQLAPLEVLLGRSRFNRVEVEIARRWGKQTLPTFEEAQAHVCRLQRIREDFKELHEKATQELERQHLHRPEKQRFYQVNDLVWIKKPKKELKGENRLAAGWSGPAKVTWVGKSNVFAVEFKGRVSIQSGDRLRPVYQ